MADKSIKYSEVMCSCGRRAIKQSMLDKGHKVCYECWKKAESKRGHFIDNQPRKKRVEAGLPVKNYQKEQQA